MYLCLGNLQKFNVQPSEMRSQVAIVSHVTCETDWRREKSEDLGLPKIYPRARMMNSRRWGARYSAPREGEPGETVIPLVEHEGKRYVTHISRRYAPYSLRRGRWIRGGLRYGSPVANRGGDDQSRVSLLRRGFCTSYGAVASVAERQASYLCN